MFRLFENLVDPFVDYSETDIPPNKLYPFLKDYCRPFFGIFGVLIVLSCLVAGIEIGLIYFIGWLVDVMQGDPKLVWSQYGATLIIVGLLILFIRPIVFGAQVALLNNTMMPNLGTLIRWRAHRHVLRQSVGWFENDFAGRIANRVMQTPPAANEVVFHLFDALSYAIAYVLGSAILLWTADPQLTLPLLIWLAGYIFLMRWVVLRVGPASEASSDARSKLNGRIVDGYTNIQTVKMFADETDELDYARDAISFTRETVKKEMRIYTAMDAFLVTLNGLLIVSVIGWAIYLWTIGSASVGVVAAAAALVMRLNAMTGWIMWAVTSFFRELGVVSEGMRTIAQPLNLVDTADAKPLAVRNAEIRFTNLSHHYGKLSGGLDQMNLTIRSGEKVGLVGRSGAGKTTLLKLLLRFYDIESGKIEIDGQDISRATQDSLRRHIGMVQQDSSLLHRSVRDNIRYGSKGASDAEVIAAAQKAQAHEFIMGLQDPSGRSGYDAEVGERGVKLSGGQRQRIALARVILKDAPVLLLDEATSALDSEVEAAIQDTLYKMMSGKTVIAIAHRLSTIAHMDRILVMDDGKIIEDGTHNALIAKGGLYAGFWARQSGGFINVD
ncbi:MAG: ABC transporter ATP-binding protein [Paracoccaceae bacterium]